MHINRQQQSNCCLQYVVNTIPSLPRKDDHSNTNEKASGVALCILFYNLLKTVLNNNKIYYLATEEKDMPNNGSLDSFYEDRVNSNRQVLSQRTNGPSCTRKSGFEATEIVAASLDNKIGKFGIQPKRPNYEKRDDKKLYIISDINGQ
uniref:Uncharacterized protein n=1 Tax=Glossina pallidipes TaxID=7398 RepID=A0A1A9ZVI0_GLOPL